MVLEIVTGLNIPFCLCSFEKLPQVTKTVTESYPLLQQEVQNENGAICEVLFSEDGFYSQLFVIPRKASKSLHQHTTFSDKELGYNKISS